MKPEPFFKIISRANQLGEEDQTLLLQMKESFPYAQSIQALHLKAISKDAASYSANLPHVAIRTSDRAHLKSYLEGSLLFTQDYQPISNLIIPQVGQEPVEIADLIDDNDEKSIITAKEEVSPITAENIEVTHQSTEPEAAAPVETVKQKTIEDTSKNDHQDILKELEANLAKLKKSKESIDNNHASEEKQARKKPIEKPKTTATKRASKDNNDLIESIKKKEKKQITDSKKKMQIDIIREFSQKDIKINKSLKDLEDIQEIEDLAVKSTERSDKSLSEAYAKMLVKQGKKASAIEIYEKLILKFPKKKAYFATQIKALKKE
ncbi:hypothetical protein [Penaeicola halotolerans]|uniref:hypothetical protein n=1 Tax=Penaeicola halotolerans TaxID=2793196 RepID=UPI001CF8ADB5|nr:hypothetical protein [Penaeicola halotolerans]